MWRNIWLSLRLLIDRRIPFKSKMLPILALIYVISPIDLIPDLSILGIADDVALFTLVMNFFMRKAPEPILIEHIARMSKSDRVLRLAREIQAPADATQPTHPINT